jgi:hypothetical protein
MQDKIKALLEDGEELVAVTSPINFVLIKRNHDITPFIIKGYDPTRNEFFPDYFFACITLEVATAYLGEVGKVALMKLAQMR